MQDYKFDVRIQPSALGAFQEITEAYITQMFERAQLQAFHRGCITVTPVSVPPSLIPCRPYTRLATDVGCREIYESWKEPSGHIVLAS